MKLIDEAKHWWRMLCMQAMGVAVAVQAAWLQVPDDMKAVFPHEWEQYLTIALLLFGMAGRLVKQGDIPKPSDAPSAPVPPEQPQ
jgi:hypothetical protein